MGERARVIRAGAQVLFSIVVIVAAITGSQILLLVAVLAVVCLLMWEFELRRRRRA
jgi:hypothetical protein